MKHFEHPSEGVTLVTETDDELIETMVSMDGGFTISASQRREFIEKLGALIDEYRI